MIRRVPIEDMSSLGGGAHRPETVAGRLSDADLTAAVTRLKTLEPHMPATWDETLARLDNIVAAAAQVKASAQGDVIAAVSERLDALEAALGVTAAVDPSVDPNQPLA